MSNGCAKIVKIFIGGGLEGRTRLDLTSGLYESGPNGNPSATLDLMTQPIAPKIQLTNTPDYRESYANSVQIRVNLWDFLLLFGRVNQTAPDNVAIQNFQAVYVSPQQAKALLNVLQQNVTQYETAFGEIRLEPQAGTGIVQ